MAFLCGCPPFGICKPVCRYTLTLFVRDSANATVMTTATITVLLVATAGVEGGPGSQSVSIVAPDTAVVLTAAPSLVYVGGAARAAHAWEVIGQPEPAVSLEGVDCGPVVSPAAAPGDAVIATLSGLCTLGWCVRGSRVALPRGPPRSTYARAVCIA